MRLLLPCPARLAPLLPALASAAMLTVASPAMAAPDGRFLPSSTAASDYRSLRDIARLFLQPAFRGTLETHGQPMCALDRAGNVTCAGVSAVALRRPGAPPSPAFATPCFGAPGVFDGPDGDPLVTLNLEMGLCAIGQSGRVYCWDHHSQPVLDWADRDEARPEGANQTRAIALTKFAALYDDGTIRERKARLDRFGPPRAITGLTGRATTMTQTDEDELCLLTDRGQVYCTHAERQSARTGKDPRSPLHFERVAAPRVDRGLGPIETCKKDNCREPLDGVVEIAAAGVAHTCALIRPAPASPQSASGGGGEIACWETPDDRPWLLPRFSDPVSFAASGSAVCAVTGDGGVECIGFDWMPHGPTEPLARVPGLRDVLRVALGRDGLCAITREGRVDCRMVLSPPIPEPPSDDEDEDEDDRPPEWFTAKPHPAVAIIGWTRDLADLAFAGTWTEFDESTTPLVGVTSEGALLGTRPPPGIDSRGPFSLVPGLPCLASGGKTFCREIVSDRWGPWQPIATTSHRPTSASQILAAQPWWLTLPNTAVEDLGADLSGVADLVAQSGLEALELIGWDGVPCLRLSDQTVRCVRRMGTRTELVPVPAPRRDRFDVCSAFVDGPGEAILERVIDIDGSHHTACALLENRDIACWGRTGALPRGIPDQPRRWAPRVVTNIQGAVEIAVSSDFVCARIEPAGEVRCVGSAGLGRAPGRWGGFGDRPQPLIGLSGITRLASLPDHPVACAWSRRSSEWPTPGLRPRTERKDPRADPHGALADALADGQAVCWGDEDALRYLNATWLGEPVPLKRL